MVDLRDMRVIYNQVIYRALAIDCYYERHLKNAEGSEEIKQCLRVLILNEDGQVKSLEDESWKFQFLADGRPN